MDDAARTQELIEAHKRRLHKLQMQAALSGAHVDPSVAIEIEDISAAINGLEQRLSASPPIDNQLAGTVSIADMFLRASSTTLQDARQQAVAQQKPIFVIIYNPDHPTQSKLHYSLGYFLEYQTTRQLVDQHFVSAVVPSTDPDTEALIPADDPLENCRWVVLSSSGAVLCSEGVYANPDEGLKRTRAAITLVEAQEPAEADNASRQLLAHHQQLWLSALLAHSPTGERVDIRVIFAELFSRIPSDFDPTAIDARLCSGGDFITLVGRALINPKDHFVQQANQIATYVRETLRTQPTRHQFTAQELATATGIPEYSIALTLDHMAGFKGAGYFHNVGTTYGPRGYASFFIDNDVFRNYWQFQSMQAIVTTLL